MQCPVCKKKNALKFVPWLGQMYRCRFCDYQGPVALREDKTRVKI